MKRYGGTALVTGASSGIGAAFARRLAREGYELVLVARREDRLRALAAQLETPARVVAADLRSRAGCAAVARATEDLDVGILIHSAGYGALGPVEAVDLERQLDMVDLNARATLDLTRRHLPGMLRRGTGAIIVVASVSSFQASPWLATYGATKAFGLSLAEALFVELRGRGVDVLALCPGPTRTEWKDVAGVETDPPEAMWSRPDDVVETALRALGRRPRVVAGALNKLAALVAGAVPRMWVARLAGRVMRRTNSSLRAHGPDAGAQRSEGAVGVSRSSPLTISAKRRSGSSASVNPQ